MKLMTSKSKNKTFYYVTESFRKGDKVSSRIVLKIGEHNELLSQGIDDPKAYALNEVKKLNEEIKENKLTVSENIDFSETLDRTVINDISKELTKNIGYIYLDNLMDSLDIDKFAKSIKTRARFDISTILRYLSFDRVINPRSKLKSYEGRHEYYGNFDFSLPDVYRCLTLIGDNDKSLQKHLFEGTKKIIDINDKVLYYDCTNFYFETEQADEDVLDDEGEILRWGLRKYGLSKEHRPNPIVQMGLFTDSNGVPISYELYHGNNNEQNTVIPLEDRMIKDYGTSQFIYCSDAGLGSLDNRFFNVLGNRNYIVTHSLKNTAKEEVDLMMKDSNWKILSFNSKDELKDKNVSIEKFKNVWSKKVKGEKLTPKEILLTNYDMVYKVFPLKRKISANFLKKQNIKLLKDIELEETIYITFSISNYFYQSDIFNQQLARAGDIVEKNKPIGRKGPNDPGRLVKNQAYTSEGEVATESINFIDEKRVEKEKRFHGFYALATSLDYPVEDLLRINASRWKIEQSFRILKTDFEARPAFVYTESNLRGHFAICYIALLLYRIIEELFKKTGKHFTTRQILTTLRNMKVLEAYEKKAFISAYTSSTVLDALEETFKCGFDKKKLKPSYLERLVKKN